MFTNIHNPDHPLKKKVVVKPAPVKKEVPVEVPKEAPKKQAKPAPKKEAPVEDPVQTEPTKPTEQETPASEDK